jgi:26S proteasome regulatory subunit N11
MTNSEPRQTTSNIGLIHKPAREAKIRGLGRIFYSMAVSSKTSEDNEIAMLANVYKKDWFSSFGVVNHTEE